MQQSSLGAIREPLIDGQIAGEHDAHVVRPVEYLLRLKGAVEVAGMVVCVLVCLCVRALGACGRACACCAFVAASTHVIGE